MNTNPATYSYTCGAGTTVLVLHLTVAGSATRTGGAPTYNGVAMTQADITRIATETNVEIWYLVDPPTGSAYTVSIPNTTGPRTLHALTASAKAQSGYTSALDVAAGNTGISLDPSLSVSTTVNGDYVTSLVGDGNSALGTGNKTQYGGVWGVDHGSYTSMRMYELQAAFGLTTHTYTVGADDWAMIVVAFKEVAAPTRTTVGDGANPGNSTVCPGDPATPIDAFTLQTNTGTDSVTAVQVDFAAGTTAGIGLVEVLNDLAAVVGSQANPADPQSIALGTPIPTSTTLKNCNLRITPKSHLNMPAPPGASYAATAVISDITVTGLKTLSDTASATITIDNASPGAASFTGCTGSSSSQIDLTWIGGAGGSGVVVVRGPAGGSCPTFSPTEGTTYSTGPQGADTIVYVGALLAFSDTGLSAGTSYCYEAWAYDSCTNYASTEASTSCSTLAGGPSVTTGVPSATVDSCTQITVSCPFTGDSNSNSTTKVEYNTSDSWPGTTACAALSGGSPRSCPVGGLANATAYYFRVTFSDTDGVNGPNPQVIGPYTTRDCKLTAAAGSATVDNCNQITASAPFTGDWDADSSTSFDRGPAATGPWTAACAGVTGASPRTCIDGGVLASSTYYYRITHTDPDGVNGTNPEVIGPYLTPACTVTNTTIVSNTAQLSSCRQITVTSVFTGDGDGDGSTKYEQGPTSTGPWTTACGTVTGPSPRQCLVTGLSPSTTYYVQVTFTDPDGVAGTNPQVLGPFTTPACGADDVAPTAFFVSPSRNAIIGGTDRIKLQVFDAGGMAGVNPVQWSIDGGALSAVVSVNANYNCGTSCAIYEFDVNTLALTNGSHYITVVATDSSANVARTTQPIQVYNVGTAAGGSGTLLRRTTGSQLCIDCHNLTTHSSQTTSTKYGNWAIDCLTCHTPHKTTNIFLIRNTIRTPSSGVATVEFQQDDKSGGTNPQWSYLGDRSGALNAPYTDGICEACHTKTNHHRNDTSGGDHTHNQDKRCVGCHKHTQGFAPGESDGNLNCSNCHSFGMMVTDASRTTKYHHVMETDNLLSGGLTSYPTNSTPSLVVGPAGSEDKMCTQCHADHNVFRPDINTPLNTIGRGANLRTRIGTGPPTGNPPASSAPGDSAPGYYYNQDANYGSTGGGICLTCHVNAQDKNQTDQKSDGSTKTPAIVSAAANFEKAAHRFGVGGQIASGSSAFTVACVKCHSDGSTTSYQDGTYKFTLHAGDNRRLLNPLGIASPGDPLEQNLCYRCHSRTTDSNPGGGPAKTVANRDYYNAADMTTKAEMMYGVYNPAKLSQHDVQATTGIHDPYDEGQLPNDGTMSGGQRHVQCEDCHNPHAASAAGDSGTASSANATSLTDSTKNNKWLTNQWQGYKVVITGGAGAGQAQTITSSTTAGVLNVASWNAAAGQPNATSTYLITRQGDNAVAGPNNDAWGITVTPGSVYDTGSATFVDGSATVYSGASGGIVTSAITNNTTVTSQTRFWVPNGFATYTFRVVVGTHLGTTRTISSNTESTLTFSAIVTLDTTDIFVIYKSASADTPTWTNAMVGGYIRNELDRNGRWYRITAWSQPTADPYYTLTITPNYTSMGASPVSNTKMTNNATAPLAQWQMDHGTLYSISSSTLARTNSVTKQYEICVKCHSAWAYGDTPPNVPSGHQDGGTVAQTMIVNDFNNNQLAYHPVFAAGKNQPTAVANANWNLNAPYTRVDNTGNSATFGLSNVFTTGWYKESLLQCTDCHASDSTSDPLGPHASGKKWILRGLDTSVFWVRRNSGGTGWETITNAQVPSTPATEAKNFCLNCHRWDVHGYIGLGGNAVASIIDRVRHDVTGNNNTYNSGNLPRSGIVCQNCHGGDRIGGIHGSNRRRYPFFYDPSTSTSQTLNTGRRPVSYSGKRLLNGAAWYAVTRATTGVGVTCWEKKGTDTVNICSQGHTGDRIGNTAQYSYDDAADP